MRLFLLRHRLWLTLSTITLAVAVAGVVGLYTVNRHVQEHLIAHLELVRDGTAMMLESGYRVRMQQAEAIVEDETVKSLAGQGEGARPALTLRITNMLGFPPAAGFAVTDADGLVLLESGIMPKGGLDVFVFPESQPAGKARVSMPRKLDALTPEAGRDVPLAVAVTAPLGDGLLWIHYDARQLFSTIFMPGRSGTTGEIYAFDRDGRMLSDSRFNTHLYEIGLLSAGQESSLRVLIRDPEVNMVLGGVPQRAPPDRPLTLAAASAIRGETSHNVVGFNDYRGVPVIGAWRWIEEFDLGITHEIDVAEAYFNVWVVRLIVVGLVALLMVATVAAGFLSARTARAEEQKKATQDRLRKLNGEMAQVNRMATMGEMATGLAHELNQPLTAIANYARAALNELDAQTADAAVVKERLGQIERGALRSGEIIKRLRKFVAHREITTAPVEVHSLVQDPLKLLSNELKGMNVTLAIDVPKDLPPVLGDEVQLQQVLLNLIRNSLEAMRRTPARPHKLAVSARLATEGTARVTLDVSDTGPGIDAKVKARLFEQFNTGSTSGMGLGLAISRTIIESHGGAIVVSRDSSEGTTFTIQLPTAEDAAGSAA